MKCRIGCLAVTFALATLSSSKGDTAMRGPAIKSISVPMPKGLVRAEALDVTKDWNPPTVHLKGYAKVRIYSATKDPRGAIVLSADSVELDETTGQITPHGNVSLSIEDLR